MITNPGFLSSATQENWVRNVQIHWLYCQFSSRFFFVCVFPLKFRSFIIIFCRFFPRPTCIHPAHFARGDKPVSIQRNPWLRCSTPLPKRRPGKQDPLVCLSGLSSLSDEGSVQQLCSACGVEGRLFSAAHPQGCFLPVGDFFLVLILTPWPKP